MAVLKVKLRQHTPIIHFQANQNGATLRASELKPKLDRFIIFDLKIINDELYHEYYDLIEKYFFKKEDKMVASSYKLRVSSKKKKHDLLRYKTAYFGNDSAILLKGIELEFFSFNKRIIEFMRKILPYYFTCNNFGQRQSKGFGCFSADKWKDDKQENWISYGFGIEQIKECLIRKYDLLFFKRIGSFKKSTSRINDRKNEINKVMKTINEDYQILKSGKNHNKPIKSKLLEYMYKKDIRWEKKGIKENLKDKNPSLYNELKGDNDRYNYQNVDNQKYRYVRAMLGLAENNEYQTTSKNKLVISIKDKEEKVDRFQSPLTFKVFNNTIFILPQEIPEDMYNRTFKFSLLQKNKSNKHITEVDNNFIELSTPISKEEFNLEEFLEEKLPDLGYKKVGGTND